jgi:hypothetical protein
MNVALFHTFMTFMTFMTFIPSPRQLQRDGLRRNIGAEVTGNESRHVISKLIYSIAVCDGIGGTFAHFSILCFAVIPRIKGETQEGFEKYF